MYIHMYVYVCVYSLDKRQRKESSYWFYFSGKPWLIEYMCRKYVNNQIQKELKKVLEVLQVENFRNASALTDSLHFSEGKLK